MITGKTRITLSVDLIAALGGLSVQIPCHRWFKLYTVQNIKKISCAVFSVHCTGHKVHCTLYSLHCTVYSLHCTVYIVQCTAYIVQCIVTNVLCSVHSEEYTAPLARVVYLQWRPPDPCRCRAERTH